MKNRLIIIGNSCSVLTHKYGDIIDRYGFVCRINDFKIDGFKNYVGSKCNIWSIGVGLYPNVTDVSKLRLKELWYKKKKNRYFDAINIPGIKCYKHRPSELWTDKRLICSAEKINQKMKNPTTGFRAIILAIASHRFSKIDLYGFTFFCDRNKQNQYRHYYESKNDPMRYIPPDNTSILRHSTATEKRYVIDFYERGLVGLLNPQELLSSKFINSLRKYNK
jgi:hypothetical protein